MSLRTFPDLKSNLVFNSCYREKWWPSAMPVLFFLAVDFWIVSAFSQTLTKSKPFLGIHLAFGCGLVVGCRFDSPMPLALTYIVSYADMTSLCATRLWTIWKLSSAGGIFGARHVNSPVTLPLAGKIYIWKWTLCVHHLCASVGETEYVALSLFCACH